MKLELKHLTPYLLYNLMLMIDGVVCDIEGVDLHQVDTIIAERVNYNISAVKPILRPLSDLKKEIEVNGEKFIADDWIGYNYIGENLGTNIATWSHRTVQKLLEWHFDIYRLIEQDLAIDINDLKK